MDNLEFFINNLNFASIFWQVTATLIFMLADIFTRIYSSNY